MATKLTLRLDEGLIERAKREARKRGTSLSRMVAGYFQGITAPNQNREPSLPPATASLLGSLRGRKLDRKDHRRHLEEKYR